MAAYNHIPTNLPPRFQIRRLEERHIPWAAAIVTHSNMFYSPVWPITYPEDLCGRSYRCFPECDYLVRHQVSSGHSFGIFDTEYQFKRAQSGPDGGLYWDASHPSTDESGRELLEQMDFPLCSVALAYDGFNRIDEKKLGPLMSILPSFSHVYSELAARDPRPPEAWQPTAPKQLLLRNSTSSRHDVEGKKLMKGLAFFMMHYAASAGFRAIQIECAHDKVNWVWTHPPAPYRAHSISEFNSWELEVEEDGKMVKPFGNARQQFTKVYVDLRPEEDPVSAESA